MLAAWAGETAVIWVSETTVKWVAASWPKATLMARVKPVPVMVTVVPPAVVPEVGATAVTVGTGAVFWVEPRWCVDVEGRVDAAHPAVISALTATSASRPRARHRLDTDAVSPAFTH